ncbi:c-type cytochrome biogenesis protein CcmI [Dichotomicrobium thermohalophilum]|uniref:Cytochrome c-type biogenesis protein CcmH n=1 Tax=Dichotomicrobium thermohalophilum TaxID=933063 RepID=A0A397Q607_9HYPH|nr:c-type cytochrome biogenesis protein CcmI [Dichotomicrobium thermohalophilum]RIA54967.1 cytochrome c-type biogenesis protein CcmH [Dichotomicrobium thermohalophilum]
MVLWTVLAVLTAIVITVVCLPLVRQKGQQTLAAASDAEIYKAQLAEIEDERARGILTESEAEAARIEVSRRLLRSAEKGEKSGAASPTAKENDGALVLVSVLVPLLALGGYLIFGSPSLPQQPYAARFDQSPEAQRVAELVGRVEERLRERPNDGEGWDVIAPVYLRQQKYHDAVFAFQQALRLNGENAARLEGLGEAMVLRDNGQVSQTARMAFERALVRNPGSLKAQFWLAVSDEQNGDLEQAAKAYRKILDASPEGAPWRAMVGTRLAVVQQRMDPTGGRAPALSPEMRRSAENMSREERAQMIENMVAGLAERLEADGSDLEGWLRLMRAYKVLGKSGEAKQAAASARENFKDDPSALERIDSAARQLGLQS